MVNTPLHYACFDFYSSVESERDGNWFIVVDEVKSVVTTSRCMLSVWSAVRKPRQKLQKLALEHLC